MRTRPRSRAEIIGDTAIAVLAAEGARGLTHRAVDRAAGLPPGSTSNHARTREALLTCALTRITELEAADAAALAGRPGTEKSGTERSGADASGRAASGTDGPAARTASSPAGLAADPAGLAAPLAAILHRGLTHGRTRLLARYELALESTRRPALRLLYDEASRPFRGPVAVMLAAAGSADPERHARSLIAWCEGVQFDALAGAGAQAPPGLAELRAGLAELLRGMLGAPGAPGAPTPDHGGIESVTVRPGSGAARSRGRACPEPYRTQRPIEPECRTERSSP